MYAVMYQNADVLGCKSPEERIVQFIWTPQPPWLTLGRHSVSVGAELEAIQWRETKRQPNTGSFSQLGRLEQPPLLVRFWQLDTT